MPRNEIRPIMKRRSTAGTGFTYVTRKNRRNDPDRSCCTNTTRCAGTSISAQRSNRGEEVDDLPQRATPSTCGPLPRPSCGTARDRAATVEHRRGAQHRPGRATAPAPRGEPGLGTQPGCGRRPPRGHLRTFGLLQGPDTRPDAPERVARDPQVRFAAV